jgi:hypothetical protein
VFAEEGSQIDRLAMRTLLEVLRFRFARCRKRTKRRSTGGKREFKIEERSRVIHREKSREGHTHLDTVVWIARKKPKTVVLSISLDSLLLRSLIRPCNQLIGENRY